MVSPRFHDFDLIDDQVDRVDLGDSRLSNLFEVMRRHLAAQTERASIVLAFELSVQAVSSECESIAHFCQDATPR